MSEEKYYAVFDPQDDIRCMSVTRSKTESIDRFITLYNLAGDWCFYSDEGYSVRQITINEVKDDK